MLIATTYRRLFPRQRSWKTLLLLLGPTRCGNRPTRVSQPTGQIVVIIDIKTKKYTNDTDYNQRWHDVKVPFLSPVLYISHVIIRLGYNIWGLVMDLVPPIDRRADGLQRYSESGRKAWNRRDL